MRSFEQAILGSGWQLLGGFDDVDDVCTGISFRANLYHTDFRHHLLVSIISPFDTRTLLRYWSIFRGYQVSDLFRMFTPLLVDRVDGESRRRLYLNI